MVLERDSLIEESLRFARENLGPATEHHLQDPSSQALVLSRLRSGRDLPDAVLGEAHRIARQDRRVADEFLSYFLAHARRRGTPLVSPALRRLFDTDDLVQSVLRDVWSDLIAFEFESRAQFISLLAGRLRWKAADKSRSLNTLRRSEQKRVPEAVDDLDLQDPSAPVDLIAAAREQAATVASALLRLPERDQVLLRLHLRDEPLSVICRETALEPETARKALQRAIRRLRKALGGSLDSE